MATKKEKLANGAIPTTTETLAAEEAAKIPMDTAKAPVKETSQSTRTYSRDEVMELMEKMKADIRKEIAAKDTEGSSAVVEKVKNHNIRFWRYHNKFVVDFVNQNTDEYAPNKVIHAFDKWNDRERKYESWIELVYLNGETEQVPLYYYLTNRTEVNCEIIERKTREDKSYLVKSKSEDGKVEVNKIEGYSMTGTGQTVKQSVIVKTETIVIKLPDGTVKELPDYVFA